MAPPSTIRSAPLAGFDASRLPAVVSPAVVRGWLYDSTEHWWALLVGAPPNRD
ncbi:MAG: hypothetical protein KDB21_00830 [Acidimicrobiales bacterium]|nr:hypothetical protein [Acidimicrobiales bacterium]